MQWFRSHVWHVSSLQAYLGIYLHKVRTFWIDYFAGDQLKSGAFLGSPNLHNFFTDCVEQHHLALKMSLHLKVEMTADRNHPLTHMLRPYQGMSSTKDIQSARTQFCSLRGLNILRCYIVLALKLTNPMDDSSLPSIPICTGWPVDTHNTSMKNSMPQPSCDQETQHSILTCKSMLLYISITLPWGAFGRWHSE